MSQRSRRLYPEISRSVPASPRREVISRDERSRLSSRLTEIDAELLKVGIGSAKTRELKGEKTSILDRLGKPVEGRAMVAA